MMKYLMIVTMAGGVALATAGGRPVVAQDALSPAPAFLPPPPPAPPPPKIEVPQVPRMDAPVRAPRAAVAPSQRQSFDRRMFDCIAEGAAAGLGPNDRARYSRECAQR
jgi:hypothetical protein